jgi:hypothetical protein
LSGRGTKEKNTEARTPSTGLILRLFEKIDAALDAFIQPIIQYSVKIPNAVSVKAGYDAFIAGLKGADDLASRINGVERNRMGIYRALAELSYGEFKRGNGEAAAKAGTVLALT